MKNFIKNITILLLCAAVGLPVQSFAQNKAEFTISAVEVEYPAGNPSKLRNKAVDEAQKKAFLHLLKNITPKSTWERHEAILEITNFDEILEKFTIINEETHPKYRLTVDMAFSDVAVKKMLADLNVPFTEAAGGKVLVIPLLELQDETYLWQSNNPWREALAAQSGHATFFQFVLPTGDVREMQMLTPEMARFGAGDVLMEMAKAYGATGAVVAKATVKEYFDGRFLEVENLWYGANNFAPAVTRVPFPENLTFEEALTNASLKAMEEMADHWRSTSLVQVDRPGRVFLRYHPQGAADLEKLKKAISDMTVVKKLTLRVLNVQDSIFQVDFYGDKNQMWEKLRSAGLNVATTNMNMVWQVAFPNRDEEIMWNSDEQEATEENRF